MIFLPLLLVDGFGFAYIFLYLNVSRLQYNGCDVFLICFSMANFQSYENVKQLVSNVSIVRRQRRI